MIEDKLLDSAINSTHNWDEQLIEELCSIYGITIDAFHIIFPKGIESLADKFFGRINEDTLKIVTDNFHKLPIHLQVAKLLDARLQYMSANKAVMFKILSMKCGLTYQISHALHISDLIWKNVNHKSSGFDYYTRRMILANVYKNCLVHFKRDISSEEMTTYAQEQLKKIGKITKIKNKICKKNSIQTRIK
jgi:rpsU-divergently transcribed protein